jgi:hypothetical protein
MTGFAGWWTARAEAGGKMIYADKLRFRLIGDEPLADP